MSDTTGAGERGAPHKEQDADDATVAEPDDEPLGQEVDDLTGPRPEKRDGAFGFGIDSANDPQASPDMGGPT